MTYNGRTRDNNTTNQAITDLMSSTTTSTTTSSSIHTEPGVHMPSAQDLEVIREYYTDLLGPLNMFKARDIERAFECGLQVSAILDAIEQTALARRPSHPYLCAILRRYAADHITTVDEATACRERRRYDREMAIRERWSTWYASPEDQMPW